MPQSIVLEGGINQITGIFSFHSGLGVLYKYLCCDSRAAAAALEQQFLPSSEGGQQPWGFSVGQNGHSSKGSPAHLHCASTTTLGEKIPLHPRSWWSHRSLCSQQEWREVKQLQWREAEFDTSVDWKRLPEHEAWKLGLLLPFHHWGNEEETHRSPGDEEDPSASMMNMFPTHYTIIFGLSGEYAYYTLSLQAFWMVLLIFLQILFRSFHITSLTLTLWLVFAAVSPWVRMKKFPISSLL